MGTPRIRRATDADASAVAALVPGLAPSVTQDHRATFVAEDESGLLGLIELQQRPDHFLVEHLAAPSAEIASLLSGFAEAAARALGVRQMRLAPDALTEDQASHLGYAKGVKQVLSATHELAGIPVWRDGTAPFSQTLFYRGAWAALALIIGLGSISVAVFSGGALTLAHIALPALLCTAGALFAIYQTLLILQAARRSGQRTTLTLTAAAAAASLFMVGSLIWYRAVPSLSELWNIYSGDTELSDLSVALRDGGRVLEVVGSYGVHSDEAVRRALAENPRVREVVLAGPGGRVSTGIELFRLFRERKLATRVDRRCASACTIAFLGGVRRSISPSGKLGFHRASFPGMGDNDMHDANRDLRQFLIYGARVTPQFAQRVIDTPAETIWVPTVQELLAGKVIDRVAR